jgi:hypothetical protein
MADPKFQTTIVAPAAIKEPVAPTHREYIAQHQIVGARDGDRKTWERGDALTLTEIEASQLGEAVRLK